VADEGPRTAVGASTLAAMCMQCMASAMAAGVAATGMRAFVAAHQPRWMTVRRLKLVTAGILAAGVLAAGSHIAPSAPAPDKAATPSHLSR
jgi:hypothetical protein